MKFSKLLVLSALWLFGLGANAADLIERTAPEQPAVGPGNLTADDFTATAAQFVVGNCYVIYNVGAQSYFGEGNAWGTQASVSETPLLVRFTLPEGKTIEDAALLFNDYPNTKNAWKLVFFDSADAMFVDRGTQANYFWQVVAGNGANTYRLQASPANPTLNPTNNPGFVGLDVTTNETNTALSPFLAEGDGHYIDWQFYPVTAWDAYFVQKDIFDLAEKLKGFIETAEAQGIDVSAAVAVYNNLNATLAQIQAAIDALKAAMSDVISKGTAENPSDATSKINNPNFDNASSQGWSGTSPNMVGSGSHGPANVAEVYNNTFDTYQDLAGLPAGVYRLDAKTAFRGSWADLMNGTPSAAKLYATVGEETLETPFNNIWSPLNSESMAGATEFGTTAAENSQAYNGITVYSPNDPSAFRLYEEAGFYGTTLFFDLAGDAARIGVKNAAKCTDGCDNWSIFDTFSLKYYGNTAESYQKWVELMAPAFSEDVICTKSYMEEYLSVVAAQKAGNRAEVLAALETLEAAAAPVRENISLWSTYGILSDSCMYYGNNPDYDHLDEVWDLIEYQEDVYEVNLEELALTNEELMAEIEKVRELIRLAKTAINEDIKPGDDCTEKYLVNADFSNSSAGWQGASSVTAFSNGEVEAYEKNPFDLYQVVNKPKAGVYSISLQGFFRLGGNEGAYAEWKAAQASGNSLSPVAWVYLNSNQTALNNVYDIQGDERIAGNAGTEPDSPAASFYVTNNGPSAWSGTDDNGNAWTFPNGMGSSYDCFNAGMYQKAAYGLVRKGEDMRIGIKGALGSYQWAIWDNFKLTYLGYEAEYVLPVLEEVLATIDDSQPMGKNVYEKIVAVKAAAEAAIAAGDGEAMFNALSDVLALNEEIATSVALFAQLSAAVESLTEVATTEVVNTKYRNEALNMASEIENMIAEHQLADEDVDAQLARIAEMKVKLRLPDNYETASDAAPVEVSRVLGNTRYDDNSRADWSIVYPEGSNHNVSNEVAESYGVDFDYFQELTGLPAGTYQLAVQGLPLRTSPALTVWSTATHSSMPPTARVLPSVHR